MNALSLLPRIREFAKRVRRIGLSQALRKALVARLVDPRSSLPLARVNRLGLLNADNEAIHARQREEIRASSLLFDASAVESSYPLVFEQGGRVLRYAYLPATGTSKGLAVLFHGHNAFLHMGPLRPWCDFDLLAPWDTFGWQRQGSWFWGEKGEAFVEPLIQALIARHAKPGQPWFATGGSMGGFGALWHGVKFGASGVYAMCPQVDLARKIADFSSDPAGNPYAHLAAPGKPPPDLLALCDAQESLPPLFLVQNQMDYVNPFADHAFKLIERYNVKNGWYGLRVHPAIGHGGDGSQEEAEMFFALLIENGLPRKAVAPAKA